MLPPPKKKKNTKSKQKKKKFHLAADLLIIHALVFGVTVTCGPVVLTRNTRDSASLVLHSRTIQLGFCLIKKKKKLTITNCVSQDTKALLFRTTKTWITTQSRPLALRVDCGESTVLGGEKKKYLEIYQM